MFLGLRGVAPKKGSNSIFDTITSIGGGVEVITPILTQAVGERCGGGGGNGGSSRSNGNVRTR